MAKEKNTALKWKFETGDDVTSSPTISDGVVYFGSDDKHLYAVDAKTGEQKWKFKTEGWIRSYPTVAEGVVFFGDYGKPLYILDVKTGEQKWKFETFDSIGSSTLSDGIIYLFCKDFSDHIYFLALDVNTGKEKWKCVTELVISSSPTISDGVVYFGNDYGHLLALDSKTGKEKWNFETDSEYLGWGTPIVSGGIIYFGNYNHFYALDSITGEQKWMFETGDSVTSSPIISDGIVYFGSDDKHFYALDCKTGEEKWKFKTDKGISLSSTVSDGIIYFAMFKHLYALDCKTGEEKWKFKTKLMISSSPTISDGVVYFGNYDNHLYAVDIKTPKIRVTEKTEKPSENKEKIKVNRLRIKGSGTGLEQKLSEIPEDLKKLIQANQDILDISELVRKYYDAKVRDEWHSFGDSHYGLTNNSDIEVIAYLDDKIVGRYTSGYTMTSDEANFRVEDEVEWTPPDDHLISYMDGNYMLHKSFEKGNFIDVDLYLDEEVDFDIKNLILEFEYEGGLYEYYCFPEKIISRIVCVDDDELEVGVIEKSGGTVNLYDKVSSTGKGIEVEICIDGEIVFSEG